MKSFLPSLLALNPMENFNSTGTFQVFSGAPEIPGDRVCLSFQVMYEELGF